MANTIGSTAGRRVVVTGANSGIGYAVAEQLAVAGAEVTLACRDVTKARDALHRIRRVHPEAEVRVMRLDLASLESVREFARSWTGHLDLLVNNAGVMAPRRWTATADGFELQFGTNHLGHFALTGRLLPALLGSSAPRVVTVSSIAHRQGDAGVLFANPQVGYSPSKAYGQSKLANLLFARYLQVRSVRAGAALVSTAAHPGLTATDLFIEPGNLAAHALVRPAAVLFTRTFLQPPAGGARPVLYAATEAVGGSYTGPRWLFESRGGPAPALVSRWAQDEELAQQLWELSEEFTGVTYDWSRAGISV